MRYGSEFFGTNDFDIKKRRMLDYEVKPSAKFVLAKYSDGFYRPASIAGRSKKKQLYVVSFYHSKKCMCVKGNDILFNHGNLLNFKISFLQHGKELQGMVYGNNSPANKGFPSMFYVKKKQQWYKVPFKMVFLTKKQINKLKFGRRPVAKSDEPDVNMADHTTDSLNDQEKIFKDLNVFDGDFEMS